MGRPSKTPPIAYERFDVEAGHGGEAGGEEAGDHGEHEKGGPDWKGDLCQCCGA